MKKIVHQVSYAQAKIFVFTASAETLQAQGRYQEAIPDYEQVLRLVKSQERRETYIEVYNGLTQIYLQSNDTVKALHFNSKVKEFVRDNDKIDYSVLPYLNRAKIEVLQGNLFVASAQAEKAYQLFKLAEGNQIIGLELLKIYIEIQEKLTAYEAAFRLQNELNLLEKAIKADERQARLDILENRFQLAARDAEIARQNASIDSLQSAQVIQRWMIFSFIITGILVVTLLYSWYRRALEEKRSADKANQAKSEFLATMSHELRTPINGVIGTTELLKTSQLSKEQKEFLDMIQTSSENLLSIVNDILDLSKIEAGKLSLENHDFDLVSCIEGVFELFCYEIQDKDIELLYLLEEGTPEYIHADSTRLRQVLVNLVGNALKFTKQGQIVIRVGHEILAKEKVILSFCIIDSGMGMDQQTLMRLFRAFEQADASITRKYGGTGLGLNISKRIVEMMGGQIQARSEPDKGTQFSFSVTVDMAKELLPDSEIALPDWKGKTIAIASKNQLCAKALSLMCQQLGARCIKLENSVEIKKMFVSNDSVDLILMDSRYCCGKKLHLIDDESFYLAETQKMLVLMCSYQFINKHPEVAGLESIRTIVKPLKRNNVIATISQGLNLKTGANTKILSRLPSELAKAYPLKILVVEDNAVNQQVLRHILKKLGYSVDIASDGLEGLNRASTKHYDLIMTDGQMPELDGISMAMKIHEEVNDQVAIILITGDFISQDYIASRKFIQDILLKPVNLEKIKNLIEKWGRELVG
nr:ATP-binding protein [Aliikangiella sp. G2MR2-5]